MFPFFLQQFHSWSVSLYKKRLQYYEHHRHARTHLSFLSLSLIFLSILTILTTVLWIPAKKQADAKSPVIILTDYKRTLNIGDSFVLGAFTSDLSFVRFSSSSSLVASVTSHGEVIAKKAGNARITVKSGTSETYCLITVKKTTISINQPAITLENGESFLLKTKTSNGHPVTYKSNKKSVATVTPTGRVSAQKPGTAVISIKADQTTISCKVTVKKPVITLNMTKVSMQKNDAVQLVAKVSSQRKPTWRTNKSSVVSVDDEGYVIAKKHGTAQISAKVDGVSKICYVTVKSPTIKLSHQEITLKAGKSKQLTAKISNGEQPVWKSSKSSVAVVSSNGKVTALKSGTSVIKVSEDGTTATCVVIVK